jgi:hypothetical protein
MQLIYAKLMIRLREKELNEAKRHEQLGDRFSDLLYSIMVFKLAVSLFNILRC